MSRRSESQANASGAAKVKSQRNGSDNNAESVAMSRSNPIRQSFRRFRRSLSAQRNKEKPDAEIADEDNDELEPQLPLATCTPKAQSASYVAPCKRPTSSNTQTPVVCAIAQFDEDSDFDSDYVNTHALHEQPDLPRSQSVYKQMPASITHTGLVQAAAATKQHPSLAQADASSVPASVSVPSQLQLQQQQTPHQSKSLTARARELFRARSSSRQGRSEPQPATATALLATSADSRSGRKSTRVIKSKSSSKLSSAARSSSVMAFPGSNAARLNAEDDQATQCVAPTSFQRSSSISRSISSLFASVRRRSRSRSGDRSSKAIKRHTMYTSETNAERFAGVYQSGSRSPSPPLSHSRSSTTPLARVNANVNYGKSNSLPLTLGARRVAGAFLRSSSPSPFIYTDILPEKTSNDLDANFAMLETLVRSRPVRLSALQGLATAEQYDSGCGDANADSPESTFVAPQCMRVWLRTSRRGTRRSVSQNARRNCNRYSADTCPLMASYCSGTSVPYDFTCTSLSLGCDCTPQSQFSNDMNSSSCIKLNDASPDTTPAQASVAMTVTSPSPSPNVPYESQQPVVNTDNRYSTATVLSGCSSGTVDSAVELGSASSSDRESRKCSTTTHTLSLQPVSEKRSEQLQQPIIVNVVHVGTDCNNKTANKQDVTKLRETTTSHREAEVQADRLNERGSLEDVAQRAPPPTKTRVRRLADDLASVNSLDDDGFYTSMTNYSLRQSLASLESNKHVAPEPTQPVQGVLSPPLNNVSVEIVELSANDAHNSTPQLTPNPDTSFDLGPSRLRPPVRDAYKLCVLSSVSSFDEDLGPRTPPTPLTDMNDYRPQSILKRTKEEESRSTLHLVAPEKSREKCTSVEPARPLSLAESTPPVNRYAAKPQPHVHSCRPVPRSVSFANAPPNMSHSFDAGACTVTHHACVHPVPLCAVTCHPVAHCCHTAPCCPQRLLPLTPGLRNDCRPRSRPPPTRCVSLASPVVLHDSGSERSFYLPATRRPPDDPPLNQPTRRIKTRLRTPPAPPRRTVTRSQPLTVTNHVQHDGSTVPPAADSSSADEADTDTSLSKLDTSAQLGKLVSRLTAVQICEPGSPVCSNYRKLYSLSNPRSANATPTVAPATPITQTAVALSDGAPQRADLPLTPSTPLPTASSVPPQASVESDFEDDSLEDEYGAFSTRHRSYRYALRRAK